MYEILNFNSKKANSVVKIRKEGRKERKKGKKEKERGKEIQKDTWIHPVNTTLKYFLSYIRTVRMTVTAVSSLRLQNRYLGKGYLNHLSK